MRQVPLDYSPFLPLPGADGAVFGARVRPPACFKQTSPGNPDGATSPSLDAAGG